MRSRRSRLTLLGLVAFGISSMLAIPNGAFAQGQAIFQDDRQIMQTDQNQVQQYENQVENYEAKAKERDAEADSYRTYAQKRISELKKLQASGGSPTKSLVKSKNGEMYALQGWLKNDEDTRLQEQEHIKQLDKAIVNLQQQLNGQTQNLSADVGAMREVAQRQADDDKFSQMMQINHFNELQSEMGAASWGRPPTDGTFNSTGGYGIQGGYGYSMGGGRRGGW
ncbi:MAG: hypothetical protein P4L53_06690 [Candidatus Obscuribacterales bacterium]|nr:hypothetical protein [Candidatus Obscuribacterales bacterium]